MKHDLMAANAALYRKHSGKYLLQTMRALGMTDDEIKAVLLDMQAKQQAAKEAKASK